MKKRKRGTTRDMIVVRDGLGLTAREAKVLDGIVGPAPARMDNGFRPLWPATPTSWEVVREHAATGRVNLVAWALPNRETAIGRREVERGLTLVLSSNPEAHEVAGRVEAGWTYVVRKAGAG